MKGILWFLVVPGIALAQQSATDNATNSQETFDGLKNKLVTTLQSTLGDMEHGHKCLMSVREQAGFETCLKQMPESMKQDLVAMLSPDQPLNYSADTCQRSLQVLEGWILNSYSLISCFNGANDINQVKSCIGTSSNTESNLTSGSSSQTPNQKDNGEAQQSGDW